MLAVLLLWLAAAAAAAEAAGGGAQRATATAEAEEYLERFGYLSAVEAERAGAALSGAGAEAEVEAARGRRLVEAVAHLQAFAGLPATGALDAETLALMRLPRCGLPDAAPPWPSRRRRRRRFARQGSRWPTPQLTFRASGGGGGVGAAAARAEVAAALRLWGAASALRFRPRARGPVHLRVSFERRAHGDGRAFDGPGGVLAHAFFPSAGGATHLDADERFAAGALAPAAAAAAVSLRLTAAHELGHALGLDHSAQRHALMAPFYRPRPGQPVALHADDVAGIQALYGPPPPPPPPRAKPRPGAATPPPPEEEEPTPPVGDDAPFVGRRDAELCADPAVDAAFSAPDGSLHFFKGEQHLVKADGGGVVEGYPRPARATWPALGGVAVAAGAAVRGALLVVGGGRAWRFRAGALARGFPVATTRLWPGGPAHPDALLYDDAERRLFLFKGREFWTLDGGPGAATKRRARGPRKLSEWQGLPKDLAGLDAVLVEGNASYALAGPLHWRLDARSMRVEVEDRRDVCDQLGRA